MYERAISEIALDCRTGSVVPMWGGDPPDMTADGVPGTEFGSSTIVILTLTEYTKYELGFATPPEAFANRDVVIPM